MAKKVDDWVIVVIVILAALLIANLFVSGTIFTTIAELSNSKTNFAPTDLGGGGSTPQGGLGSVFTKQDDFGLEVPDDQVCPSAETKFEPAPGRIENPFGVTLYKLEEPCGPWSEPFEISVADMNANCLLKLTDQVKMDTKEAAKTEALRVCNDESQIHVCIQPPLCTPEKTIISCDITTPESYEGFVLGNSVPCPQNPTSNREQCPTICKECLAIGKAKATRTIFRQCIPTIPI
jgi:hypothetical protein